MPKSFLSVAHMLSHYRSSTCESNSAPNVAINSANGHIPDANLTEKLDFEPVSTRSTPAEAKAFLARNAQAAVETFREWQQLGIVIRDVVDLAESVLANQRRAGTKWHFGSKRTLPALTDAIDFRGQ